MEFIYSIGEAFKDISNKDIRKLSILNGIGWAVIWIILGMIFYEPLLEFTKWMINLLPFTFVKSSGAEFILIIMWLQAVLITIGIVFSLFDQYIKNKFISPFVALMIAIVWFLFFFSYQSSFIFRLERLIRIFPFESIEEAVSNVLAIFIFYSFYVASIYLSFLFLSIKNLEKLQKEEYPNIDVKKQFSFLRLFLIMFRDLILFIVALFVLYPLLFVPFVNIIIIIVLWTILIKSSILEIVFMVFGKENINNKIIWSFSLSSVILNFVPIVNLFAPAFGLLSVYHYIMEKKLDKKI